MGLELHWDFQAYVFFFFLREGELGGEGGRRREREDLKQTPRPMWGLGLHLKILRS